MKDVKSPKQVEEVKREYFKMNINSRLDSNFTLEDESEKQRFLELCKYVATILSLGQIFKSQGSTNRGLCHLKHVLYFIYLVGWPVRGAFPSFWIFFVATAVSLLQRKLSLTRKSDSFLHMLLADEECMHGIWFLTYLLLGAQMKVFVDLMFLVWAFLNTMEWFDFLIMKYPSFPIIGLFANLIKMTQDNTTYIVQLKNYVEIALVPVSLCGWTLAWCAPVLGIILVQAIRIKYLGSFFTKKALIDCDEKLLNYLPGFIYESVVTRTKVFLSGLSGVKESLENEEKNQMSNV